MPTNRIRRRRVSRRDPDAIEALRAGLPIEYSPEAWEKMLDIYFFGDYPDLPAETIERAADYIAEWKEQHFAVELAQRRGKPDNAD